jgi:hypothetical protein
VTRLLAGLEDLPTTNTRIAVTLLIAFGTALRYWLSNDWEPSPAWLAFVAAMSGLDAAQFHSKRKTYRPEGG